MKKPTGRARQTGSRSNALKLGNRRDITMRPVPDGFDVGEGPTVTPARRVARPVEETFDVGEGIMFRPLDASGIGQQSQPLEVAGAAWKCRYGCPGVRNAVADLELHTWDCPYWEREGKTETPF